MGRPLQRVSYLDTLELYVVTTWKKYNHLSLYNMKVRHHTGITMCRHFYIKHFMAELDEVDQILGFHDIMALDF
jgi:hypothetical protein